MFVLAIVLAVLSGLTLVAGMVWAVARFGRKVVCSGPEVWQEMKPQGQIQLGYGTGMAVESRVSMRMPLDLPSLMDDTPDWLNQTGVISA
jgi:hypothetical protein